MLKQFLITLILSFNCLYHPLKAQTNNSHPFYGIWIATVDNLHWPSKKGLSSEEQQKELCSMLDLIKNIGLTTVLFQVRPACDALYASKIEPWSEVLTGTMGKAPEPYYDPLEFIITESHKRGLKLHAWINPFRAHATYHVKKGGLDPLHISQKHPHLVVPYGKRLLLLNPGEPEAQKHVLAVIKDIVTHYNIDGFHIDDYFYPYPEPGYTFYDEPSYKKYGQGMELKAWRRDNINRFVKQMYIMIKNIKPEVEIGISPFGIWQPDNPEGTKAGINAFDDLCADSKQWLEQGWCDYFIPQLYWKTDGKNQNYKALLTWWKKHNIKHKKLIAGNYLFFPPEEIGNQIAFTQKLGGIKGNCFYSIKPLQENKQMQETLKRHTN